MPKAKTGILDQKFTVNEAKDTFKAPQDSELLDRPFTINQVKETGKELFSGFGCDYCGGCGMKPIRTAVHYYADDIGTHLKTGEPFKNSKGEAPMSVDYLKKKSGMGAGRVMKVMEKAGYGIPAPTIMPVRPPSAKMRMQGEGVKRVARFAKGSEEAKAWGRKMAEARMKK